MPLVQTRGAASAQGFGEFAQASAVPNYIEEVFSTFLYTGNGSTQTITNNIDLSTKGGLVWLKERSPNTADHNLVDTVRGVTSLLFSNLTNAAQLAGSPLDSFSSTGFVTNANGNSTNSLYATWTFRKQPKFFDIVTWTGTGSNTTIAHALGSVPACIMVKRTDTTGAWQVYHRSLANTEYLVLNATASAATGATRWNSTTPTSSVFSLGTDATVNASGGTYVAYIFAHDAGGFGLTGTDNVISCGTYTGSNSSAVSVNLGYEPQWVMIKRANGSGSPAWWIGDTMRGLSMQGINRLEAWDSAAEGAAYNGINPTSTGFVLPYGNVLNDSASSTYIYIAIRRGPMKVPTVGTTVFSPIAASNSGDYVVNAGFPPDMVLATLRDYVSGYNHSFFDRLRGNSNYLKSSAQDTESGVISSPTSQIADFSKNQNGIFISTGTVFAYSTLLGITYAWLNLRRAPSFFDVVCYTGTNVAGLTFSHNLAAVPELMIMKVRNQSNSWQVYTATTGNTKALYLDQTAAASSSDIYLWNDTSPTSTQFTLGQYATVNANGATYAAYLFATCAGVSKVGSYTGTGATQTVSCGFTGGARFVMVKRTDSTGDWYVWDTARGMVSGTDPSFLLNTTGVEVNANSIYTTSVGFQIVSTAAGINANGGTYIFLAIA